jgi:hypothetical protein
MAEVKIENNAFQNTEGPQKCIHTLTDVIYGYNRKVEPKYNVRCVV